MRALFKNKQIASVRQFNRLYTRRLGLLNKQLDGSPYSLSEARVLYEIAHGPERTAAEIARFLGMDRAQMSRILGKFFRQKMIVATPSSIHAKHQLLALTAVGKRSFAALDLKTQQAIAGLIAEFPPKDREKFVQAVQTMKAILEGNSTASSFTLRPPQAGDLGWVIHRQALLYAEEYGWDWTYEALVSRILAGFVENFDPVREQAWMAEADGNVIGSVFLMRGDTSETAKLRLLYVEKSARGLGVGRALVNACIQRAREIGYKRLELWTNSVLVSARRIYEAAGFELLREEPHHSFGKDLVGQTWRLKL